jgi:hypothetical protein
MKKNALFFCDPADWQRVLLGEYALTHTSESELMVVYDFEHLGEPLLKTFLRALGVKSKLKQDLLQVLRQSKIRVIKPNFKTIVYSRIQILNYRKLPNYVEIHNPDFSAIYPNLVNITGRLKISVSEYSRVIRQERAKSRGTLMALTQLNFDGINQATLVNGRFTKSLTIRRHLNSLNIPLKILEYASTQEKYEIFEIGPHSNFELGEKMRRAWSAADPGTRDVIASDFFKILRDRDPSAGVSWTSAMIKNSVPDIPKDMKILTFFSSSESEFVGVRDQVATEEFANQATALNSLLEITAGQDWVVYLRRHPKRPDSENLDVEDGIWEQCRMHKHLVEINPFSHVDSFALAFQSDVVAHYDSSIGPQLINMGHPRVITLGNTLWSTLDEFHNLRTTQNLREYLNNPSDYLTDVRAWAYFRAVYGKSIQNFVLDRKHMSWRLIKSNQ